MKNHNLIEEELKKEQNKIEGVNQNTLNTAYNSTFEKSEEQKRLDNSKLEANTRVQDLTSKDKIVSDSVKNTLNSSFTVPTAVKEADTFLSAQLQKIQSGKTSYSDQVRDMMAQIQGREKFSYDVDSDPLFQQALASAMNSGKTAMQDTIGQASALTGGYGSTYATTAGNQAYNAFIEDAYDNLPQYYQMAMEAYQMEGDELYRQLGMYSDADALEYDRMLNAYNATSAHRNQAYNEAYQLFRDKKTDAYNLGSLQLSEHGQLVSDALTNYNAVADYADTMYTREYQSWADAINNAWKQAEFERGTYESDRAYEFDTDQATKEWEYKAAALQQDKDQFEANYLESQRQFNATHGDTNGDGELSEEEIAAYNAQSGENKKVFEDIMSEQEATKAANSPKVAEFEASILTATELRRRGSEVTVGEKTRRFDNYSQYVDAILDDWYKNGKLSENETLWLMAKYGLGEK